MQCFKKGIIHIVHDVIFQFFFLLFLPCLSLFDNILINSSPSLSCLLHIISSLLSTLLFSSFISPSLSLLICFLSLSPSPFRCNCPFLPTLPPITKQSPTPPHFSPSLYSPSHLLSAPFTLPIPLLLPHYLLLLSSPSLHFLSLIKPYYTSLYRTSPHVILPNFTSHHVSHQIQYSHMPDPYTYLNLFIGLPFNYRKSVLAEVSLLKDHKLEYLLCKNPAVEVIMDEYLMLWYFTFFILHHTVLSHSMAFFYRISSHLTSLSSIASLN